MSTSASFHQGSSSASTAAPAALSCPDARIRASRAVAALGHSDTRSAVTWARISAAAPPSWATVPASRPAKTAPRDDPSCTNPTTRRASVAEKSSWATAPFCIMTTSVARSSTT